MTRSDGPTFTQSLCEGVAVLAFTGPPCLQSLASVSVPWSRFILVLTSASRHHLCLSSLVYYFLFRFQEIKGALSPMLLTAEAFWECGVQYQQATYMTVFKRSTDMNDTVTRIIYTTHQIHHSLVTVGVF